MRNSRFVKPIALVLAVVGLLAVLELLRGPSSTVLWLRMFDAGHAPLFGLLSLAVLGLVLGTGRWTGPERIRAYVVAFAISAAIGVVTETVQFFGPRDANVWDLVRDLLGSTAFLLAAFSFDRDAASRLVPPHVPIAALFRIGAALALGLAFIPLMAVGLAYASRSAEFPRLCDFQGYWEAQFVTTGGAGLKLAYLPEPWNEDSRNLAGKVTFYPVEFPNLHLLEPYPDWTGYDHLAFEVYSEIPEPLELEVRIDDAHRYEHSSDRFQTTLSIVPGINHVRIPLRDVQAGPRDRSIDLSNIRRILVFAFRPEEPTTLYFDAFRLE